MSVYVLNRDHIDMLLTAAEMYPGGALNWWHGNERHTLGPDNRDEAGAMLIAANVGSFNRCYGEDDDGAPAYRFRISPVAPTPVQVLKGIDCLEYQSCELPDWADSEAYAFLAALTKRMIRNLPGYSAAPWEWTREKVTQ